MYQYMGKLAALAAVIWAISCLTGCAAPTGAEITEPEVEGVIVAADGGNNAKTAADITDAVVALFGIEVHKIKVMKKV